MNNYIKKESQDDEAKMDLTYSSDQDIADGI